MSEGRMRFFGMSEDKLYYDESKKRFVNTKDAPAYIERGFKNGHFKDVRAFFYLSFSNDPTFLARKRRSSQSS